MAHNDFQNRLGHLNLRNLCLEIGFERGSRTRDAEVLKAEVKQFLKVYESYGTTIPPCSRADPIEARLCATSFLVEEGRGERLFSPNSEGAPIWPTNRDLIIEAVTHIFRLRAFNNKQLRDQKARRDREIEGSGYALQKRSRRSNESFSDSHDSRLYEREVTESSPDLPLPTNLNALDQAHYLKPWHEDPERFNRRAAISHIKDLNPSKRTDVISEFTLEWLSKNLPWPLSADPIVAQFMHQRNFYVSTDLKSGTYREVVDKLRINTELDSLNGPQYIKLERRVGERIKHLTAEFYSGCFLQTELDGSSTKTKRFQQLWESREEHWKVDREATAPGEDGHRAKRRRRSTKPTAAPKSPIIFPNIAMPPEVKIRDDLKSMAGSVLEHLNSGAQNDEPVEEYVVITPKSSPLGAIPSGIISLASATVPDMAALDESQKPSSIAHKELPPPITHHHQTHAPFMIRDPTPKTENGPFLKPGDDDQPPSRIPPKEPIDIKVPDDHLMPAPSPELNHSILNSSLYHNASMPDHSSPVYQNKNLPSDPLPLSSTLTENEMSASSQLSSSFDTPVPASEPKNDYEVWHSSGVYQLCLKLGLKELPGLSEKAQAKLWSLEFWLHPEKTSEFTLQNFCSKNNIPGGVAQYKEWWTLQNETERNKRLHPYHRAPNNPPQKTIPDEVPQTISALEKPPTISSKPVDHTDGVSASHQETIENPPSIQQPIGDIPLKHHHHFIACSSPRINVQLDAKTVNGSIQEKDQAKFEHEVQRLQMLSQEPGGIPQFDSELDLNQFLMAHNITEWGYRYWERNFGQRSNLIVDGSLIRENVPMINEKPTFVPYPQKSLLPESDHSHPPLKPLAPQQEWTKAITQPGEVLKSNYVNEQSFSPNSARNLLPKIQNFTPSQWSPPSTNNTSSVKQTFTPVSQPTIFVVGKKPARRREKRAPKYQGEQFSGPARIKTQFLTSNSDRANNVWRDVVNVPASQPPQSSSQHQRTFPSHPQTTHYHSSPISNPHYLPPVHDLPKIDASTYSIPQSSTAHNPNLMFAIPQPIAPKADPITPSRTPSPNKVPEQARRSHSQGTPSMCPSVLPQATPELAPSLPHQSSPAPSQTYPPTPSTSGPSPHPSTAPNLNNMHSKTLDVIFQLPTKDLDFDSPVPFPSLEKISISQFFHLFAEKTKAKLEELERVTMTPAFGHQQSFVVERFGDAAAGKWEKARARLRTMWIQQTKREPEKDDFEVWVEVEE